MAYVWGLVRDGGLCLILFLQWLIVGAIVDATTTTASGSIGTKRAVSLYLAIVTLVANCASLFSSFPNCGSNIRMKALRVFSNWNTMNA